MTTLTDQQVNDELRHEGDSNHRRDRFRRRDNEERAYGRSRERRGNFWKFVVLSAVVAFVARRFFLKGSH